MKIGSLEVHELANLVPLATDEEQLSLLDDIKQSGQLEPIVLYRGKIIDGRCRAMACEELGIQVKSKSIPNNTALPRVADIVKSLNTRRNLTGTQKAIVAVKFNMANPKSSRKSLQVAWGVTNPQWSSAKWLIENEKAVTSILLAGNAVKLKAGITSKSLQACCKYFKEIQENRDSVLSAETYVEFDPDGYFDTVQQGKDYNELVSRLGGHNEQIYSGNNVRTLIAGLIKNTIKETL